MLTTQFFDVLNFTFQNFHAQRPKWTFIWTGYKNPNIPTP